MTEPLLKDLSSPGRRGFSLPELDVPKSELPPREFLRSNLDLPEVSELDVVRHFVRLSEKNFAVDANFYPLGSCTMKYNPKINEDVAGLPGFTSIHPYQPPEAVQGALQVLYELQGFLAEITGMSATSVQPAAGAHGELTGMLMVKAYHDSRGDHERHVVVVPDSAHGTNPATASMCGYDVVTVRSDGDGNVDIDALHALISADVAGVMLTLPNTLGLFDTNILEISRVIHDHGALLYGDGANMNAILGQVKPGDLGFDVIHLNLHKTFSTPHGGGGPGCGPVCVKAHLAPFLPSPVVEIAGDGSYAPKTPPASIGRVRSFYGNFALAVRAYAYIRSLGAVGLAQVSENAVLNANYLLSKLKDAYRLPYNRTCMHEFVLSGTKQRAKGVKTLDIAKRLIDFGFHPPTIYFPLIVEEALMIEPTETESRETLDAFAEAMLQIAEEAESNPEIVKTAPHTTPVSRLDEAEAARHPNIRW